ncbi:MAG: site-2 protease family protein [Anaerolineae bacterium]|nr:site-2 protease family protein [Anaerolineae bacterium]
MQVDRGFGIGKLFGIDIRVDWSWLFIFFLTTWNLATALANLHSEWNVVWRWGLAVAAALLFFASVLAHEMAHSLVARSRGMPVNRITLFLFGGVSNIEKEPESPGAEFVMAIVGPLASLIIGGVLLVVVMGLSGVTTLAMNRPNEALQQLGPVTTILIWVGAINVTLGIFNMIPGFPLDGGRVLRSILWSLTDNLHKATRWASWIGQGIAWLMILSGIAMTFGVQIPFFGSGLADGLWLAFIGWCLNTASSRSYQRLVIQDVLEDVRVSRMMRSHPSVIQPDITIAQLIDDHIMRSDDHAFPVIEQNALVGLVTLDDVRSVAPGQRQENSVRDIMTPVDALVTVAPEDAAATALQKLARNDVRQLPVIQDGALVGVLSRRSIVRWLQLHADAQI